MLGILTSMFFQGPYIIGALFIWISALMKPKVFLSLVFFYETIRAVTFLFVREPSFQVFGLSIYPRDVFFVGFLLSVILKKRSSLVLINKSFKAAHNFVSFLIIFVWLGLVSWSIYFGPEFAYAAWREKLFYLSLFFYTTRIIESLSASFLRGLIILPGVTLTIVSAISMTIRPVGNSDGFVLETGESAPRLLTNAGAFMILLALVQILAERPTSFTRETVFVVLAVAVIVLVQQRTIWVATTLAITLIIINHAKSRITVGFSSLILIATIVYSSYYLFSAGQNISYSASNLGTLNWRIIRGLDSISIDRSIVEWIFGSSFSASPANPYFSTQVYAHNALIDLIEWLGILGVVLHLGYVFALIKACRTSKTLGQTGRVITYASLVYAVTYSFPVTLYSVVPLICLLWLKEQAIDSHDLSMKRRIPITVRRKIEH